MADAVRPSSAWGQEFEEALRFFRQKIDLPSATWRDIEGRSHDRAFVVAGAMKEALLSDLRAEIDRAIAGKLSLADFRKNFDAIAARHGWTGWTGEGSEAGRAWRTRVIYETNLRTAYAAGRYAQMTDPDVVRVQKWWRYRHAWTRVPERERPEHAAWDGRVLAWDDPWWEAHYPPNGWNCSCGVETLSDEDLEEEGVRPDETPPSRTRPVRDPKTGETVQVPVGVDFGWDHAPGRNWAKGLVPKELERPLLPAGASGPVRPPPAMPTPRPFRADVLPADTPPERAVERFLAEFGAAPDKPALWRDPAGHALPIGGDLFQRLDGSSKSADRDRHLQLPRLAEAIKDPDEIWLDWMRRRDTGLYVLVRRYLRAAPDGAGFASFSWTSDGWEGSTVFAPEKGRQAKPSFEYLERQRAGALLWRRND